MSRPAISVMLPCFNAAQTLPLAVASLLAQTVSDWECVCLDDGSSDDTWEVLRAVAAKDRRFRLERFTENRGRGAARARILELVEGKFLAFLDADDWCYPDRFEHELRWLEVDPNIMLVTGCSAVTQGSEELIGLIRPPTREHLPHVMFFEHPSPPPILFPNSMINAELAKRTGFDPAFRRSQDGDFLVRALLGKHFAMTAEVLYAYSASATSPSTTLEGYRYRVRAHVRHWRQHPLHVGRTVALTAAKVAAYKAAALVGADARIVARRWGPYDDRVAMGFADALARVSRARVQLFGD